MCECCIYSSGLSWECLLQCSNIRSIEQVTIYYVCLLIQSQCAYTHFGCAKLSLDCCINSIIFRLRNSCSRPYALRVTLICVGYSLRCHVSALHRCLVCCTWIMVTANHIRRNNLSNSISALTEYSILTGAVCRTRNIVILLRIRQSIISSRAYLASTSLR